MNFWFKRTRKKLVKTIVSLLKYLNELSQSVYQTEEILLKFYIESYEILSDKEKETLNNIISNYYYKNYNEKSLLSENRLVLIDIIKQDIENRNISFKKERLDSLEKIKNDITVKL